MALTATLRGLGRTKGFAAVAVGTIALGSLTACGEYVLRETRSPNGDDIAFVVEVRDIDGPNQRLGIRRGAVSRDLGRLAPDNEACGAIVWRQDGGQVGFVVTGQDGTFMRVFDPLSGRVVGRASLSVPGTAVRMTELRSDGTVTFEGCAPRSGCVARAVRITSTK